MHLKRLFPTIIIILIVLNNGHAQDISSIHFSGDFQNTNLKDVLNEIEKEHQIVFFYKKEWLADIKVTKSFQNTPLDKVLEDVLFENKLSYITFNPHSIFLINEAPEKIEITREPINTTPVAETPATQKIIIGNAQNTERGGNATLNGYMREAKTGKGIIGGTVYVEELKKGTVSNEHGFYSLILPAGSYHIAYSYLGLGKEIKQIILRSTGTYNIELSEAPPDGRSDNYR